MSHRGAARTPLYTKAKNAFFTCNIDATLASTHLLLHTLLWNNHCTITMSKNVSTFSWTNYTILYHTSVINIKSKTIHLDLWWVFNRNIHPTRGSFIRWAHIHKHRNLEQQQWAQTQKHANMPVPNSYGKVCKLGETGFHQVLSSSFVSKMSLALVSVSGIPLINPKLLC